MLFRSSKHRYGAPPTRIDVLFTDVRALELRAWTDGLFIEEVEPSSIVDRPSRPTALIEPGNRVYALRGNGWEGFIVAGAIFTAEDDKEESEPSSLLEPGPP